MKKLIGKLISKDSEFLIQQIENDKFSMVDKSTHKTIETFSSVKLSNLLFTNIENYEITTNVSFQQEKYIYTRKNMPKDKIVFIYVMIGNTKEDAIKEAEKQLKYFNDIFNKEKKNQELEKNKFYSDLKRFSIDLRTYEIKQLSSKLKFDNNNNTNDTLIYAGYKKSNNTVYIFTNAEIEIIDSFFIKSVKKYLKLWFAPKFRFYSNYNEKYQKEYIDNFLKENLLENEYIATSGRTSIIDKQYKNMYCRGNDIKGHTFYKCVFYNIDFSNSIFFNNQFYNCIFVDCYFNNINLQTCFFTNCKFKDTSFNNSYLQGMECEECIFKNTNINFCTLRLSGFQSSQALNLSFENSVADILTYY